MHKLSRQVRFSVDPFAAECEEGANSYSSKPFGEGLCYFFGLWVELVGEIDPGTGFVLNVVEIDRIVRGCVVGEFVDEVRGRSLEGKSIGLSELGGLIRRSYELLEGKFYRAKVSGLKLELSPYRSISIQSENLEMLYYTEKFEFAAMHTLWNDEFSEAKNYEVFGKCANPTGHGHNYLIDVTVCKDEGEGAIDVGQVQRLVDSEFLELVDHRNLNVDVEDFSVMIPTVENISGLAWRRLEGKFSGCRLTEITVWENDRTSCTYRGEDNSGKGR